MQIKLKGKLNLLIIALLTISIGTIAYYLFNKEKANLIQLALKNVKTKIQLEGLKINDLVLEMSHDVKILSKTPPIQGIIRAQTAKNGIDPFDDSTEDLWRSRLETIFEGFIQEKENYSQIRFIGKSDSGREIVRVEKRGLEILRISKPRLQSKGSRFYFKETVALPPEKVYISPITLNREFGKIVKPHTATIRIATPVHDSNGNIFGLVIINFNIDPFLKSLILKDKNLFVINSDGDFLAHQDPKFNFGFDLGKRYRAQDSLPGIATIIKKDNPANEYSIVEGDEEMVYLWKQHIGPQDSEYFIGLLHKQPILNITKNLNSIYAETAFLAFGLLGFSLSLGMFFTRRLTKPLEQMTQVTREFSEGQQDTQITINTDDEIGILGRTLNEMIDERNRKDKVITRLSSAVQQSPATIVITGMNGDIEYANPSFYRLTGFSESECLGQNMSLLKSGEHPPEFIKDFWDTILEGKTWRGIWCNKKKNGEIFWANAVASCIKDKEGNIINFVEVKEDITEQVTLNEELQESNRKLEMSNQALKDYVSFASHDLREPLRKIHLFGDRLQNSTTNLEDKPKDYLNRMINASKRMELLLDNLLEYSRISSEKVNALPFPLEAAINEAKDNLEVRLIETGGTIEYSDLPTIYGDKLLVIQLLQNLISNSLKFTREGVSPKIKISSYIEGNSQKVILEDNGIGIDDQYLNTILKPFERLHGRSEYEGTGIGLAICRMVVEKHSGSITIKSKLGEGSTFTITLPKTEQKE